MKVLNILSLIWRHGGIMDLQPDGEIKLSNHNNVPREVLVAAEPIFDEIKQWFHSWKDATPVEVTLWKALSLYCGWQRNEAITKWLEADESSMFLLHDWTVELAKNGWSDVYDDYRQYQNDKTNEMAQEFFKRAVAYKKRSVN